MDLVLLLGAHRTGSTALERVLARNEGALGEAGLTFWPQAELRRDPAFNDAFALTRRAARKPAASKALEGLRARLAAQWQGAAEQGMRGVLLSEENMLGHMAANLRRGAFYPRAAARLRAYAALLPAAPRRIGLGIRSYADYWISAYRYSLPRHDLAEFSLLRSALTAQKRGWCDLVTDIATVFPEAELLVWPQEALGTALPAVAARLTGYPTEAPALTVPARRINAAPQAGDAALIHDLRRDTPGLKGAELEAALASLRAARTQATDTQDQEFTALQRRGFAHRYAEDLAEMADGHAGAQLIASPPPAAPGDDAGSELDAAAARGMAWPVDERDAR
ncbi:hypothetical protein U879_08190 [Defluviimonas sp. 20V17]|uniref:Sulfotransferase family protein n=1 Tax=Allgaiera indica TaxID=765699 RepID=A0AAN4UNU2_9RHOB|nr:hypothetical protein [Allgaiera indica]KDB04202.1 hypothetical protein U879_08190 [Defluviimonas sp. 20V17]GHD99457.1 hypothetical protein GCM10008024_06910 [Allgaiera indica]SDW25329.1 hypothetical protein SAMN05444006_102185 [Allgaiera indica]